MPKLSPTAAEALAQAFCTRGPNKGMLLANCPRSTTLAAAAWQGAMLSCNPYKASIAAQMFFDTKQREIANEVTAYFDALPKRVRVAAQKDRKILEGLGVW